jgi:folate-dependent phosphoribosylglycinamide formyltransferase PurN
MRVVLYVNEDQVFINRYYLNRLVNSTPDDYLIVAVRKEHSYLGSVKKRILRRVYEWRFGKPSIRKDNDTLQRVFLKEIPPRRANIKVVQVNAVNDAESEQIMQSYQPHVILQLGAGILKENIYGIATYGTINVHHGYAPEIRGQQSTLWALYYGLTNYLGVTCHFIDAGLDTGAVIEQYTYPYKEGDSYLTVQETLIREGYNCLEQALNKLRKGSPPVFSEQEVLSYYFSYFKPELYEDLKSNDFRRIGDIESYPKKKMKVKRIAEFQ